MSNGPGGNRLSQIINQLHSKQRRQDDQIQEILGMLKASVDTPKYIEDIPGRRVPYFAPVDLTMAANSTSKVEGVISVSTDGPFVVTLLAAFYRKTSGAYTGLWGPVSTLDARIAAGPTGQQHGLANLLDQPHAMSGDFEVVDRGSGRNWQEKAISSGMLSPQAGGAYVFPAAHLFDRNSTISVAFTPGLSVSHTGVVQVILAGYKIVQGDVYQP